MKINKFVESVHAMTLGGDITRMNACLLFNETLTLLSKEDISVIE